MNNIKSQTMFPPGEGGMGAGDTHYISMGRDVPTKDVLFSKSVWNGVGGGGGVEGVFHSHNLGRDSNIPFWKWVHVCLEGGGKLP